ncbi:MAG: PAS domain-containing protein [Firmicutes bacterium]|nr:PAS domain-containing protein [Bacillota bacterium]
MEFIEKTLRSIIDSFTEAIIGINKDREIIVFNKKAEELLEIEAKKAFKKHIVDVISNTKMLRVIKTGKEEINQKITFKGKELKVNRFPIKVDGEIEGAISIVKDITAIEEMREKINEDKDYIDIINTLMNTFNEWAVVVDEKGMITMMSDAYKEFIGVENPEGKNVTEIIPNTRMHIVLKTGEMEIGEVQEIKENKMIAMRVPIKKKGKIVGAVGKVMFKDISNFYTLSRKINNLEKEIQYYKDALGKERVAKYSFKSLVGNSKKMNTVKNLAKKAAKTDSNILISGESGTGKELFAHAIHNASKRKLAPFIKINCAAIPPDLLESELFGYEEGAFTGAKKGGKKGKFELANGGTILLDEIGDMPMSMQVKLLRVIQEKEIERIGGNTLKNIDVRIIASTNKNLEKSITKGEFRQDLYYRLNVMKITIPPLKERKEDIPHLANSLRVKVADRLGIYAEGITKEAMEYLVSYNWPGNVRELENVIERAINLLDSGLSIDIEHLPSRLTNVKVKKIKRGSRYLKEVIEDVEREVIVDCLEECEWNKNKASRILGISRAGLYNKINQYGLKEEN